MSELETAFLKAIRDNPDDDTAPLIYADYLEERGDPRGELIRVQIHLLRRDYNDPLRPVLARRELELLNTHGSRWTEALQPFDPEQDLFAELDRQG